MPYVCINHILSILNDVSNNLRYSIMFSSVLALRWRLPPKSEIVFTFLFLFYFSNRIVLYHIQ